jgi:hypothetical protein
MNLIREYQYLTAREQKRLLALGVAVLLLIASGLITLGMSRCQGSVGEQVQQQALPERDAMAQIRDAFFAVSAAIAADPPAGSVEVAVRSAVMEKGAELFASKVDGTPLKFNPTIAKWASGRGAAPAGTVLVVGPAPASYKSHQVTLIGFGRGGLPVEIAAGSEPDWLPKAVVASKP